MRRAFSFCLTIAALFAFPYASAHAQLLPVGTGNTPDSHPAETPVAPPTMDKIKLPPGSVVFVVDEIKEALSLLPKMVLMAPAEYQKLLNRLAFLEKQLKAEKKTAHACKLAGHLEGDFVLLRADFVFTTEQRWTTVFLGLQGAHLTDEGTLDRQIPFLECGNEGFLIKVEKEGTHQLSLSLKVPVNVKRPSPGASGGPGERVFELGLPGSAVTTLTLDMPAGVKEVRWNDTPEKPRTPNHWELALGKIKTLSLSWKEPVALPGNTPLLTADSQIVVKVEDHFILVNADITLEDLRVQTKLWQLLLPKDAKVAVKGPAGLRLLYPEANRRLHLIQLAESSAERLLVNVEARYPRPLPGAHLPIGPFWVFGAYRQEGTITVRARPEDLHGQRLLFHRIGDIYPRDIPKGQADVAAVFKFWNIPGAERALQGPQTPLELELNAEKSPVDASVDHFLQARPGERGWLIDLTTTIQIKSKPEFLEIQMPHYRIPRIGLLGVSISPFPAALPWLPIAASAGKSTAQAVPLDFRCEDDALKMTPPDVQRRTRLTGIRSVGSEVKLTGKYLVPLGTERFRIDLPRPMGVVDRERKVRIRVPEQLEVRIDALGLNSPAPDKHDAQISWDTIPESVEISWKPYRPDLVVSGLTDIWLHDRHAEVKHQVQFTLPRGSARAGVPQSPQVRFQVPAAVRGLTVVSGGKLTLVDAAKESAWILPAAEPLARAEIVLRYEFSLPKKEGQAEPSFTRIATVPIVWPEKATRQDAKVRIWSETGIKPLLDDRSPAEEPWSDSGIEIVPGSEVLPALIVHGTGADLPLSLRLVESGSTRMASLVCERGLIQVAIDEEGMHTYRARYFVSKLNTRRLDVEFPLPAANCLLNVWLDRKRITNWEPIGSTPNIAQIPVQPKLYHQPVVLEIEYTLPASFTTSKRFWRTMLYAPQFRGEILLSQIRWQVGLPYSWVALVPGGMEYRWGLQGWLLGPEATASSADLESWLTEHDAVDAPTPVSLAFARAGPDNVQIWYVSRQLWLLLCSGGLLAVGVALLILPLPRSVICSLAVSLGIGVLAVALLWPGWIPPVLFGCEPGALVLIVVFAIHWMLQGSYRRRLVFMPGFTRAETSSSLIRSSGSGNRREPSTIDNPVPVSSSSLNKPSSTKGT